MLAATSASAQKAHRAIEVQGIEPEWVTFKANTSTLLLSLYPLDLFYTLYGYCEDEINVHEKCSVI